MAWLCAIFAAPLLAQISPGPLSQAHAQLEGLTKCLSCHEVGQKLSNAKCLKCHTAIDARLQQRRGFHTTAMAPSKTCAVCHSEHNGATYALIHWEKNETSFDHRQSGYFLEGNHARAGCRDCHQSKNLQDKFSNDPTVRPAKTFLGLSQNCLSCHGDEHRGQLGTACERCHDFSGWKPAAKFAHERAQFVLTGKHQSVACAKCHLEKAAREKVGTESVAAFAQYTGLPFSNCTPCHQDPHRGGFGGACAKCHVTEGWKSLRSGSFNHDRTAFPLRGKHVLVKCEKCHRNGDFKKKLAHQACRDCHQDAHAGQFAKRTDQGRCESCHAVEGFVPARFTLAEHQKTAFPLAGAHFAVACSACHTRQSAGPFAGKLLFVFPNQRCQACHQEPHLGQFKARVAKGGCEVCHRNEAWSQTKFDHNAARFALVGAHAKIACSKCHPRESVAATIRGQKQNASFVRYQPLSFRCVACHHDAHHGQFGNKERVRCEKCHRATAWPELLFEHNRDSAFKLEGAHAKAPCEKCHVAMKTKDQAFVVVYKPLKKECAACHG